MSTKIGINLSYMTTTLNNLLTYFKAKLNLPKGRQKNKIYHNETDCPKYLYKCVFCKCLL